MNTATLPATMAAVVLTGYGGFEKLEYRTDVPTPHPGHGEVLIRVRATGVNNTDINTRTAWYSKAVRGPTNEGGAIAIAGAENSYASWTGEPFRFPRIQGADCYGDIVGVGSDVDGRRIGERVLVRTMLRAPVDFRPFECWTFGSECDGGFAQYAVAPSRDVYSVASDLSDEELGVIPCTYGTAEGMLLRANIGPNDRILIAGASGGVGSAAIQLAKLRGAEVIAVASSSKISAVARLGADFVIDRRNNLVNELGAGSLTAIVDLVAGNAWPDYLSLLKRGGRYVTAGAIAGPIVEMDVRSLYLKDLTLFGCTFQEDLVFENIGRYLAEGRLKPIVAKVFPLKDIVQAQKMFIEKDFIGKIGLIPPRS